MIPEVKDALIKDALLEAYSAVHRRYAEALKRIEELEYHLSTVSKVLETCDKETCKNAALSVKLEIQKQLRPLL